MDLMRRLRLAGRPNSSNHNSRSRGQSSSSQAQVGPGRSQASNGRSHAHPTAPPPPQTNVPTLELPQPPIQPICINPPVNANGPTVFPWKFHSGVVPPGKSRRQLRPSRPVCLGTATHKSHCENYPDLWTSWRKDNFGSESFLVSSENQKFAVHPILLAGVSPIFKSMYNWSDPEESFSQTLDIDSKHLSIILQFVYNGTCEVTPENVDTLMHVTKRFQISGILQLCCYHLMSTISNENSVKVYLQLKGCSCDKLESRLKVFIVQNFKQALTQPEFVDMTFDDLESLLRDDRLNVRNEELAFTAIKHWIEHAPEQRQGRLIELLQSIRFGLMELQFFSDTVMGWKYIVKNPVVLDSLFPAQMLLAAIEARSDVDPTDPLARPRVPYEIIFAIGGWSAGSPTTLMETYDVRADRWFLSAGADITPRAYHGLVTLNHKIYMIGGFDGNEHFNTMRCFDTVTRTWSENANMHFPRCYISCCVLDGQIYAIGGFNGRLRMNSVERYDPPTNQWTVCSPMTRQRSDASACSLLGKIYVAGGFNGQEVLNSVEVFDPVENQWSFIHPMRSPRSGVVLATHSNKLYAIGGFNGFSRLSSAERYTPQGEPQDWEVVADMSTPRSNFAAAVIDDMIFVIGGFNGTTTIPYVECYDSTTNTWIPAAHMNLNRSALAACVLRGLPNACDFSYLARVQEIFGLGAPTQSPNAEEDGEFSSSTDSDDACEGLN